MIHLVNPSRGRMQCMYLNVVCAPLLAPSGPLSTVHSSILPKGSNIFLTSVSDSCFPNIPTNSFLSTYRKTDHDKYTFTRQIAM